MGWGTLLPHKLVVGAGREILLEPNSYRTWVKLISTLLKDFTESNQYFNFYIFNFNFIITNNFSTTGIWSFILAGRGRSLDWFTETRPMVPRGMNQNVTVP